MGLRARIAGRRPPPEARALLDRDEHVLTWGRTETGEVVMATRLGLWVPGPDGPRRVGWHEINKASWDDGRLTVVESTDVADGVIADARPYVLRLTEEGGLPAAVRERVTASVAYTVHHQLPGLGGLRVVGRRVPGVDGVGFVVRYDEGTDRSDPIVVAATEQVLAQGRAAL